MRVGVTAAQDMKDDVLRYVDFDVEQIWKTFPEYADITKSYLQFKAAILVHYPDATGSDRQGLEKPRGLAGKGMEGQGQGKKFRTLSKPWPVTVGHG